MVCRGVLHCPATAIPSLRKEASSGGLLVHGSGWLTAPGGSQRRYFVLNLAAHCSAPLFTLHPGGGTCVRCAEGQPAKLACEEGITPVSI